jgi:hypothetical protein
MIIDCLSCQKEFEIIGEEPDIKKQILCPHCHTAFEVTWLYPFTMDFVEEISMNTLCAIDNSTKSN